MKTPAELAKLVKEYRHVAGQRRRNPHDNREINRHAAKARSAAVRAARLTDVVNALYQHRDLVTALEHEARALDLRYQAIDDHGKGSAQARHRDVAVRAAQARVRAAMTGVERKDVPRSTGAGQRLSPQMRDSLASADPVTGELGALVRPSTVVALVDRGLVTGGARHFLTPRGRALLAETGARVAEPVEVEGMPAVGSRVAYISGAEGVVRAHYVDGYVAVERGDGVWFAARSELLRGA